MRRETWIFSIVLLLAAASTAETLEQRQARAISVLERGLLRHSAVALARVQVVQRVVEGHSQVRADDIFVDAPVVEGFHSTIYDLKGYEVGSAFTEQREPNQSPGENPPTSMEDSMAED